MDDRGPVPTVPPGVTSFPPPFAPPLLGPVSGGPVLGGPMSPPETAPVSPAIGDPESASGAAIEALAERMAVGATRLRLISVEQVDWPNGCLGADLPGMMCAQAVTPGYRVLLRYDTGSTHEVRTAASRAVWIAQSVIHATVRRAEGAGGVLLLTEDGGVERSVMLAPGTQRIDLPAGALKAEARVVLGVDDLGDGSSLRAVWIAPADG